MFLSDERLRTEIKKLVSILEKKGHPNPLIPVCGFFITGDPTYLPPEMRGSILVKIDPHAALAMMVKDYLENNE